MILPANVKRMYSNETNLENHLNIIGTVLIHGAHAPKFIRKEYLKLMNPGTVMVDVTIDQRFFFETSHATSHSDHVYYCR
jgi:alanine dehydrogenase